MAVFMSVRAQRTLHVVLLALLTLTGACTRGGEEGLPRGEPTPPPEPPELIPSEPGPAPTTTPPANASPEPTGTREPDAGGQTGSIGQSQCSEDDDCRTLQERRFQGLDMPIVLERALIGSACLAPEAAERDYGVFACRPQCACYYGWNGSTVRTRENATLLGGFGRDCDEYGKGGDCLAQSKDFPGCDPASETSCGASCAELEARITADNARVIETEIRTARCQENNCRIVARVGERCYVGTEIVPPFSGTPVDCALSDEAILASHFGPTNAGGDSGAGTGAAPAPAGSAETVNCE